MPFEIPESWEWATVDKVCTIFGRIGFRGYTKDDLVDSDGAITLSPSNIIDGKMNYDKCTYISWDKYDESPEIQVHNKDILLVKTGSSYGKCALVEDLEKEATINPQFVVLRYIGCNERFLTFLLQSNEARKNYENFVLGTAIPTFTQVALGNMIIPIPPLAEQNRIVEDVEKWYVLIDQLEQSKQQLTSAIQQAKVKILDLAIHGKLVPQDNNDEPASELLKRLGISSDNRPYEKKDKDVPSNWAWCKLESLCSFLSRGKSPKYSETDTTYPVFAQKCNLKDGGISLDQARFLDPSTVYKWDEVYKLRTGDVLVNSTGTGTVGRTRLFNESYLGDYAFVVPDSHVSVIRTFDDVCSEYIYYLLISKEIQQFMEDNLAGSTNQKELYINIIGSICVPLPPFNEQVRIADKVEELFKQLDTISSTLE